MHTPPPPNPTPPTAIPSQAGFSMIVVFLIMIAMVSASSMVLIATRTNVRSAGSQREKTVSRYVAEAAVAQAKATMLSYWSNASKWSTLLASPPPQANSYVDYTYGGGSTGLPQVKSRLLFYYSNNNDDPSQNPTMDQDGKLVITARGEILDPASSTPIILAATTIEVQVYKGDAASAAIGYGAQSHGGANQASYNSIDANGVDFSNATRF